MNVFSNIWHLVRVGATFERTGALAQVLEALGAPKAFRIFARVLMTPVRWIGLRGDQSLPPVVRAIEAMGPAYVKFGQILSTRPDVVGVDLAQQLRILQDRLPSFDTKIAKAILSKELGITVDEVFVEFSDPVAAASIAQVHRAKLVTPEGRAHDVAVKVLRPNVERRFARDIAAFYFIAGFLELVLAKTRRLRPRDVVAHFESTVQGELDLRLEAAAASHFASNVEKDAGFNVPKVHWNYCDRRVMVLDWVGGAPLGDTTAIDNLRLDRKDLARTILQMFLRHALRDGYFHADMHHGNLKVSPSGEIWSLDFGIMGHIDLYTRRVYAQILHGFIRRDYDTVARVHFEAGYVPADQDVARFARALRAVGEPIFGMDAGSISMGKLLFHLFEVTEQFGMETRTELILLQRTMVVVEGVARSIDPQVNMWKVAEPVVADYVRSSVGPKAFLEDIAASARVLARFAPRLPEMIEENLRRKDTLKEEKPKKSSGSLRLLAAFAAGGLAVAAALEFWP